MYVLNDVKPQGTLGNGMWVYSLEVDEQKKCPYTRHDSSTSEYYGEPFFYLLFHKITELNE